MQCFDPGLYRVYLTVAKKIRYDHRVSSCHDDGFPKPPVIDKDPVLSSSLAATMAVDDLQPLHHFISSVSDHERNDDTADNDCVLLISKTRPLLLCFGNKFESG